ncbi:hypothetical protein LOK49_LG02G02503 [Camellia lanceoleosa]|uniref:Uncharacterized protein n=1 Tax=Camellia lanceoleosa TaxID=1840588 RepID=A0ACC0IJE0_9ERIC|nr:hypothetical protein LOK49_LG02G02503 [Camellia lanceoleosa]
MTIKEVGLSDAALDALVQCFSRKPSEIKLFDCRLHGCSQDLVFPAEKQLPWSFPDEENIPCGPHCYKLERVLELESVGNSIFTHLICSVHIFSINFFITFLSFNQITNTPSLSLSLYHSLTPASNPSIPLPPLTPSAPQPPHGSTSTPSAPVCTSAAIETLLQTDTALVEKSINTICFLTINVIENADSGHPVLPMGYAPMGHILHNELMKYNPKNPYWSNRDRFVLSVRHGCMLQYALLHLAGNADEGSQLYRNALQVLTDSKCMPLDDNVMEKMIDLPNSLHLVGRVIFNTLFGLSVNYWMAICTRFLLGSFNGLLGPIKAYACEIFNKEYQALGLSMILFKLLLLLETDESYCSCWKVAEIVHVAAVVAEIGLKCVCYGLYLH